MALLLGCLEPTLGAFCCYLSGSAGVVRPLDECLDTLGAFALTFTGLHCRGRPCMVLRVGHVAGTKSAYPIAQAVEQLKVVRQHQPV